MLFGVCAEPEVTIKHNNHRALSGKGAVASVFIRSDLQAVVTHSMLACVCFFLFLFRLGVICMRCVCGACGHAESPRSERVGQKNEHESRA